jgi:hypothetical protein
MMHTQGSAFLARRELVTATVGANRWEEFLARFAEREPFFAQQILPETKIPMQAFLDLNDALVDELFDGDQRAHWRFGEASAEWASRNRPYREYFDTRSFKRFIDGTPRLWRTYYDEGDIEARWYEKERYADVCVFALPIVHIHFEYNVMGYTRRGLELTGATIKLMRAISSVETGDGEIRYQFYVEPSPSTAPRGTSGEHALADPD